MASYNRTTASNRNNYILDIPDQIVTIGTATNGVDGISASVAFTVSSVATGGPVSYFTATSTPGSFTANASTSPITVSGLTTGTAYTFKVKAGNATGYSSAGDSAASNSVTPVVPTSFEPIATVTAAGGESTLNFTSIPSTYKHLQIRGIGRLSGTSEGYGYSYIKFNDGSQATHGVFVHGETVTTDAGASSSYYQIPNAMAPSNAPTGTYGALIIDIHDYASTTKLKTARGFSGYNTNGAAATYYHGVGLSSALATGLGTSALTSVQITSGPFGETFVAGSQYSLYGIRG